MSRNTAFELTGRWMSGRQVRQDGTCPDSFSVTVLNSRTKSNLREQLREVGVADTTEECSLLAHSQTHQPSSLTQTTCLAVVGATHSGLRSPITVKDQVNPTRAHPQATLSGGHPSSEASFSGSLTRTAGKSCRRKEGWVDRQKDSGGKV